MEGRVYRCSWEKIGDRYRVWWVKRPAISAEGATFDEADAELSDAICGATGDGESQHEYDPPTPDEQAAGHWLMIGGNESGRAVREVQWFVGGECPECRHGVGPRTDAPLVVASMQSGPRNVGTVFMRSMMAGGSHVSFVSELFLETLTAEERDAIDWRRMTGPPRTRKRFFEVIGARTVVPYVMPSHLPRGGWWCEACGHATTPFYGDAPTLRAPTRFVSAGDLGALAGESFFVAGQAPDLDLCVTRERWQRMKEHKGAAGCRSYAIGVVPEHEANRARPTRTWREAKVRR